MKFSELGIDEQVLKAIPFETPTEVQEKCIPLILAGKDIIAGSATGSGKTLAFAAGIIQHVKKGGGVQAMVLCPTRELAQQVSEEFNNFAKHKGIHSTPIYGGVGLGPQVDALRHAEVAVGTPGRVLDLLERNGLHLSKVSFLVLDEADRMLDMGFIDDVRRIIRKCPLERQTLLFSATISRDIASLSRDYMKSPVEVSVNNQVDPKKLKQIYYDVIEDKTKFSLLVHFLKNERSGLVMVFCNTQSTTDFVARQLHHLGISALAIHGGFTQAKRNQTMERFNNNKFQVLVCTDVASRGLDIEGVSHVYNYDTPKDPKSYVHRIGRTARAGADGIAITLLGHRDHDFFRAVKQNIDVKIEKAEMPEFEMVKFVHHSHGDDGDRGDRVNQEGHGFRGRGGGGGRGYSGGRGGSGYSRGGSGGNSGGRGRGESRGGGYGRRLDRFKC